MPLPSKRNPQDIAHSLEAWFTDKFKHPCSISDVAIPIGTGMSSETILFTLHHKGLAEPMVARIRPSMDDWPVFPVYDLGAQVKAMQLVAARSSVPVPNIRFTEESEDLLGDPFFIMDRVDGNAPPDMMPYTFGGSVMDDFSPTELRELQRNSVNILAQLHAISLDGADTTFAAPNSDNPLQRLLEEQHNYYDWARSDIRYPTIEAAFDWLDANTPTNPGPTVLSWGDARIGNILYDRTRPVTVLDWEMVNLAPAGIDVGWMSFMHRFFQNLAVNYGMAGFPDFMLPADVLADYVAAGGFNIGDLHWYEVYGAMRFAAISIRTSGRQIAYGEAEQPDDPEDLIMHKDLLIKMIS
ncbi:MAG: phosphotransferase family protein [Ilumatobacteraceae bacterium]|nr:phosphotransferase family protein [Ilumatobacteraceae bacterium]